MVPTKVQKPFITGYRSAIKVPIIVDIINMLRMFLYHSKIALPIHKNIKALNFSYCLSTFPTAFLCTRNNFTTLRHLHFINRTKRIRIITKTLLGLFKSAKRFIIIAKKGTILNNCVLQNHRQRTNITSTSKQCQFIKLK